MKHILLSLIVAAPIVSALAPSANAAALAGVLTPHYLGSAVFKKGANGSVPTGAITLENQVVKAFGGTWSVGAIKTGFGTLTLSDENTFSGDVSNDEDFTSFGSVSIHAWAGTLDLEASNSLDGLVINNTATVTLSDLQFPPMPPSGLVNNGGVLIAGGSNGTIAKDGGNNADAAPASAPVPEPASALLFALGLLAASPSRRRCTLRK